jgi:hypothetical protein
MEDADFPKAPVNRGCRGTSPELVTSATDTGLPTHACRPRDGAGRLFCSTGTWFGMKPGQSRAVHDIVGGKAQERVDVCRYLPLHGQAIGPYVVIASRRRQRDVTDRPRQEAPHDGPAVRNRGKMSGPRSGTARPRQSRFPRGRRFPYLLPLWQNVVRWSKSKWGEFREKK